MRMVRARIGLLFVLALVGPARAQLELPSLATVQDVPTSVRIRHDWGEGVGFNDGYLSLDAFVPFYQIDNLVFFNNSRYTAVDDSEFKQWTTSLGARYFEPILGRVFGLSLLYDNVDTGHFTFHQASLSWEILGDYLDVRGNFYFPEGRGPKFFRNNVTNLFFQGYNIILVRDEGFETPQRGLDVEMSFLLPPLSEFTESRLSAGYYHYSGGDERVINGVRSRFDTTIMDMASVFVTAQHDNVFNTTISAGVQLNLGGPRRGPEGRVALQDRRADSVQRNPVALIRETNRIRQEPALDAVTGRPIQVRHVNSTATGGDGTFERPFTRIEDLNAGSAARDILFLHADSRFTQTGTLTLKADQILFGEGIPHRFTARQGTFLLPRATTGTNLPNINATGVTNAAISLNSNNRISGLFLSSGAATNTGITNGVRNVGTFIIDRNTFSGFAGGPGAPGTPGRNPIAILDAIGTGIVVENRFTNGSLGISVRQDLAGSNLLLGIRRNRFIAPTTTALQADINNGFLGLAFTDNGNPNVILNQVAPGVIQQGANVPDFTPP